jgi:hypothetical protein
MSEKPDYADGEYEHCWNCGGEGYTWECIDGSCLDADIGCELCERRCSVCTPAHASPELQEVLAEALANSPPASEVSK